MEYIARISFSLMILLAIINIVQAEEVGIRSDIHDISENNVTWNYYTFPGFYYDLDNDIGTETLSFQLLPHDSNNYTAILSDQIDEGIRGAIYETKAFNNTFSFDLWGQYDKIDFLGKDYFAGYNSSVWSGEVAPVLYNKSKNRSLMQNGQLSEILWDDNTENTIDSSTPLDLDEGYRLAIKALDADGKKVYLELTRSNKVVDSKVVSPSIENATVEDATYYYKKDLGATKDIVLLAVHFKNAFRSDENNVATIDGVFQISEKPISISTGQQYGEMSVRSIDPVTETIILDNKDRPITLSKNKDIKLMGDIYIRTADQSDSDNPLRYYLYSIKALMRGIKISSY
jgi:S-layer protein (TIGR01567 family)